MKLNTFPFWIVTGLRQWQVFPFFKVWMAVSFHSHADCFTVEQREIDMPFERLFFTGQCSRIHNCHVHLFNYALTSRADWVMLLILFSADDKTWIRCDLWSITVCLVCGCTISIKLIASLKLNELTHCHCKMYWFQSPMSNKVKNRKLILA